MPIKSANAPNSLVELGNRFKQVYSTFINRTRT